MIFGADVSSSVHIDNKKKIILIPGKGPTNGLEDTMFTVETLYLISFTEKQKKFCEQVIYLLTLFTFKTKVFEINVAPLCLRNVSKDFPVDNMKQTGFYG